jgi:carbamoyl-phosphate synthase large subunit
VRLETKDGISSKGRVLRDEEMEYLCLEMARHLSLKGPPACSSNGTRAGGSSSSRSTQDRGREHVHDRGVNIPMLLLGLIAGTELALKSEEVIVLRYYEEVVLDAHAH